MGRKKNEFPPEIVTLTLIEPTKRYLDRLVATGLYGNNAADAAKIILLEKIRLLIEEGKLVELPPMTPNEGNPKSTEQSPTSKTSGPRS